MHDRRVGALMEPRRRPAVVDSLPRSLYLETTNRCDSKCQTCIRTFRSLEPPADLTLDRVRAIVDQLPALERVVLHGIGEPLLNAEIFDIVQELKARGASVVFNSDAIGLTEARAVRLVSSGLDEYRVSMDAATRATYRRIRGVDCFDRVIANIARLVARRRAHESSRPHVSLWFTAMTVNLEELPAFVALASQLGVDEVHVQRLVFNGIGLARQENSLHGTLRERERLVLDEAERLAHAAGVALSASGVTTPLLSLSAAAGTRPWGGCQRPWTLSYVTANGNVLPCCISPWVTRDYAGLILGNAFTETLAEIWNGDRYRRFRDAFESDVPPEPCRSCGLCWSI